MNDFDFRQIAPRCGGPRESFEELCCQLASRTLPREISCTRLRGAGGDGGVECFADLPDGTRIGWQAKYVFEIDSLIKQITISLTTALQIHKTLTRYIVCLPFNLTGKTARRGQSEQEKFAKWQKERVDKVTAEGRKISIELWPESKIRSLLIDHDTNGGIREFFFNHTVLSPEWFSAHLDTARATAGPRYTPELNVETDLWKWFASFGRTGLWSCTLEEKIRACRKTHRPLSSAIRRIENKTGSPVWPSGLRNDAESAIVEISAFLDKCINLTLTDNHQLYKACVLQIDTILGRLEYLENQLAGEIETQHGVGTADSRSFRQFEAEYNCRFPTANLDVTRDTITVFRDLSDWLRSPACFLAFERTFVLTGVAGSGKTHGVCDAAHRRFGERLLTCVVFGHVFRGEPDPWTRTLETLGLPITIGMNGLLDALNAAGEASGSPLILCVDAINETRPLRYWHERISAVGQAVQRRPHLRLCVTCRTSFESYCLPVGNSLLMIEHVGFAGIERDACKAFFQHYEIDPPIEPILRPEMANPLYLKLVCETLRSRGQTRLPPGWAGIASAIVGLLDEKEKQFSSEFETSVGAKNVSVSIRAIARVIADSGDTVLSWSRAQQVIAEVKPQANTLSVLDWLVRADLLIEDAPRAGSPPDAESTVRPAFERIGDFLIAGELFSKIDQTQLAASCRPGGALNSYLSDRQAVEQNGALLGALSILIPEQIPDAELPNMVEDRDVRAAVLKIAVKSFPWRHPRTLTTVSCALMREAIGTKDFSWEAMDVLLSISWRPSTLDAIWVDGILREKSMPERDTYWCVFLHDRYESNSSPRRLIDAAFELPLHNVDRAIAERWATILLWFTAAADRRVKDRATRAVTALLIAHPDVIPNVLQRMLDSGDDEVLERVLLVCYGALIVSRNLEVITSVANIVLSAFRGEPTAFDNALIRDHIRCIAELARECTVPPDGSDPELTMHPIDSEWPLVLPSDEEIKRWEELPKLVHSCLHDDFFCYSMNSIHQWFHAVPKTDMAKWILGRVASGFSYEGSGCEDYDKYMLGKYGFGRAREMWAERIGKKYQWIAMCQLGSRLHDHVERKLDSWEQAPQRTPLILIEERKLDPTLLTLVAKSKRTVDPWWLNSSVDFELCKQLTDVDWVMTNADLPSMERLLSVVERDGQKWRLLVSCPSWGERRDEDSDFGKPYRHVWIHLKGYLIPKTKFVTAYNRLHRRNFFGRWIPDGSTLMYGFAGEYPWATPFNTDPEDSPGRIADGDDSSVSYLPCWNQLAVEWEYDASLPENFHMYLPGRVFFIPPKLWWNGRDGYRLLNDKTIFRDPSIAEGGPSALIADADHLHARLDKMGLRLMWVLLGEKIIIGRPDSEQTPRCTFSQTALLNENGSIETGARVFFEDYNKDTCAL